MEAPRLRRWVTLRCLAVLVPLATGLRSADAASYQTVNFSVTAARTEVAEQVGQAAEDYRRRLAIFWLGKPLPNWSRPCKITVREGTLGAGGQTTFQFVKGEVLNWNMQVQGSLERILDSVLPHEINHTVFACHFRRPLPRWADEGAATLFEHRSEQLKQLTLLNEVVRNSDEMITLRQLLSMKEYPKGQRPMLTLYAQGYALADFLVQQKGRHAYLKFIADGERSGWDAAIRTHFDHDGIDSLERNWRGWVLAGMPQLTANELLASAAESSNTERRQTARPEITTAQTAARTVAAQNIARKKRSQSGATIRLQSPDQQTQKRSTSSTQSASRSAQESARRSSPPAPGETRRASFEAPRPASRVNSGDPAEPKRVTEESDDEVRDSRKPSVTSFSREEQIGPSGAVSSGEIVPTALRSEVQLTSLPLTEDSVTDSREQPTSFEFSGVLLPVERNVNSGGTPQWAGFPGQKKLF